MLKLLWSGRLLIYSPINWNNSYLGTISMKNVLDETTIKDVRWWELGKENAME